MTVLQALFISRWLTVQPLMTGTIPDPAQHVYGGGVGSAPYGLMVEESILALYLHHHREDVLTPSNVQHIPMAAQAAVTFAGRLTLAASLTCCSGEQHEQQDRDKTIELCKFLHKNGEHQTLESLLMHLVSASGDQADTPALMYLFACCSLQLGENHRANAYYEQAVSNSVGTVRFELLPTEELGLVLHRSNDGLIIVGIAEGGVVAQSSQVNVGDDHCTHQWSKCRFFEIK